MGPDRAFSIYGIIKVSEGLIYVRPVSQEKSQRSREQVASNYPAFYEVV